MLNFKYAFYLLDMKRVVIGNGDGDGVRIHREEFEISMRFFHNISFWCVLSLTSQPT